MSTQIIQSIERFGDEVVQLRKSHEAEVSALRDRIEMMEALADRPRGSAETPEQRDHKQYFLDWLRRPTDGNVKRRLEEVQARLEDRGELKAMLISGSSTGGYAVPKQIADDIERRAAMLNPFRSLVRVVECGTRDYHHLVSTNSAGSGWVGETDSRSETSTSTLIDCAPTFGTLYAYPKASEESMQDIFFDVQGWLVDEVSDGFAASEVVAIVSGNGTSKPSGFLHTTPVADLNSSPLPAVTALEYIPTAASPVTALTADMLIDLMMSVDEGYLLDPQGCAWVMNRQTAAKVMKLKDPATGAYLWQQSLVQGQPSMLLGYPVYTTAAMPNATAGQYPIAFGNWRRGYLLADRVGSMQITVDNNITTPGYVKFYCRKVVGGKVLNSHAVKVLKMAAS